MFVLLSAFNVFGECVAEHVIEHALEMSSDAEHTEEPAAEGQIDDTKAAPNGAKVEQTTEVSKSSQALVDGAPSSFLGEANHLTQQQPPVLFTKNDMDLVYDLQLYLFQENAVDVSASVENQKAKSENLILRAGSDITLQRLQSNAMWPKLEPNVEKLMKSPSIRFSVPVLDLAEYMVAFAKLDRNDNNELDSSDSDPRTAFNLQPALAALRQVFSVISGQRPHEGSESVSFPEYVESCRHIASSLRNSYGARTENGASFLEERPHFGANQYLHRETEDGAGVTTTQEWEDFKVRYGLVKPWTDMSQEEKTAFIKGLSDDEKKEFRDTIHRLARREVEQHQREEAARRARAPYSGDTTRGMQYAGRGGPGQFPICRPTGNVYQRPEGQSTGLPWWRRN
ncbi:unnamed protein product [Amoebophrya sp. A120]|nr:unnamed protein product [Amoebophrya sp. A120]|eukprot:GSA120T00026196001.1